MIRRVVRLASGIPVLFDALRWMLEGGFRGHHSVFQRELFFTNQVTLDIGCGTGQWIHQFAPDRYLGLDVTFEYLIAARQRFPNHTLVQADGRCLPIQSLSIGRIMISGVLHHLNDDIATQVLRECVRVLKPGGILVVWEDIPASPWTNPVGHLAHRLDNGDFIRTPEKYQGLLLKSFDLKTTRTFRSGFMDYAVFLCQPRCD